MIKIKVHHVKVNPLAKGAEKYSEDWELVTVPDLQAFQNTSLHAIQYEAASFYVKNRMNTQLQRVYDDVDRILRAVTSGVTQTETFFFTNGDYDQALYITRIGEGLHV